jgi:hypothetical protein
MLFQVNTQIVLKSAFLAILAISSGKLVRKHSCAAKALRVFRCTIAAICVLALVLLLLSFVLLATIAVIMGSGLSGIIGASLSCGARLRRDLDAIPEWPRLVFCDD